MNNQTTTPRRHERKISASRLRRFLAAAAEDITDGIENFPCEKFADSENVAIFAMRKSSWFHHAGESRLQARTSFGHFLCPYINGYGCHIHIHTHSSEVGTMKVFANGI